MEKVINLGIPHVGEEIFESINTQDLFKFLGVSETWKVLAENVLVKRKGVMLEACKSGETKVVQLLLERCNSEESELKTKDIFERTPFIWACQNGHKDVVKLLLDHEEARIDLNAKDYTGSTAFIYACENGHKDVVQLLLDCSDRNIDFNAKSLNETALLMARNNGYAGDFRSIYYENSSNIEFIRATSKASRPRIYSRRTALMYACIEGHKDVVKLLLDYSDPSDPRIDLNISDWLGRTALFYAKIGGHQEIIQLFEHKIRHLNGVVYDRNRKKPRVS